MHLPGFDPGTPHTLSECSTAELRPLLAQFQM